MSSLATLTNGVVHYSKVLQELKALPEIRSIPWTPGKELPPELSTESSRTQTKGAFLLSTRGSVNDPPCSHCARGVGRFLQCISLEGWFHGACATCQMGTRGNLCSLRNEDTESPVAGIQKQPSESSHTPLSATPRHTGSVPPQPSTAPSRATTTHQTSHPGAPASSNTSGPPPKPPKRSWDTYTKENGERLRARGVYISPYTSGQQGPKTSIYSSPSVTPESATYPSHRPSQPHQHALPGFLPLQPYPPNGNRPYHGPYPPRNMSPSANPYLHVDTGRYKNLQPRPETSHPLSISQRIQKDSPLPHHGTSVTPDPRHGDHPATPLIDTLPRKKQKQIFGIIGGLQSGIRSVRQQADDMQKQLDILQMALGIDPEDETNYDSVG